VLALRCAAFAHGLVDVRPSTNCRPSSWMARTVAATTVLRAQALQQAGRVLASGRKRLDRAMALADRGQHACGPSRPIAVEVGPAQLVGRQRDGGLGIGHTQQGFGQPHQRQALGAGDRVFAQQRLHGPERRRVARTACTQGRAAAITAGQSSQALQGGQSAVTTSASGR
jgi:hypothetical protein